MEHLSALHTWGVYILEYVALNFSLQQFWIPPDLQKLTSL